jgi:dGTPase
VAQIAEGIAQRLNHVYPELRHNPINTRLCAAASLVHDLGHPPFGHNGERALDDAMLKYGGFEGNAQTLRILAKLEKKVLRGQPENGDARAGLNLTYRLLGAVLKYDRRIPQQRKKGARFIKGYYTSEAQLVARIKTAICNQPVRRGQFKTIECWIMDTADDIAYSTYDLEDSLKAGFLTPASILASDEGLLQRVAAKVSKELGRRLSSETVLRTFAEIFSELAPRRTRGEGEAVIALARGYRSSEKLAQLGHLRTKLSSQLVHEAINSVELEYERTSPMLSKVRLNGSARQRVEVLKQYTFEAMIYSARVKLPEFRGYEVVQRIFNALASPKGHLLMPDDVRETATAYTAKSPERMRTICDFVAGMTDRYAVEFYGRLHSDTGQSMFKPI